jgi:AAA+ ATPase superfamily predicted ATPase
MLNIFSRMHNGELKPPPLSPPSGGASGGLGLAPALMIMSYEYAYGAMRFHVPDRSSGIFIYYALQHNVMAHNVTLIDREEETAFLEEAYAQSKSQFIILYGRRRVGKTYLLQHFMRNKKHAYYLCTKGNEAEQIRLLSRMIGESFNDTALMLSSFSEWRTLFIYLHEKAQKEKFLLVIDEFPYLINSNPSITSIFQKYWDEYLSNTKMMLVLCGSSIAMMESEVLAHKSPLYGRRTGQWKVKPLDFENALKFFPKNASVNEAVRIYAITGGVPFYLVELDSGKTATENILERIAKKGRLLYEEGEILLKEELRDPSTYFSILEAMSAGNRKQVDISNHIGMPSTALPRYLTTLERLEYIEKILPVTEPKRSKKTIYKIRDNFMGFWFKFIYPYRSYIEESNYEKIREILDTYFEKHVSFAFEGICRDFFKKQNAKNLLPAYFTKIGTWYGYYRDEHTDERKTVEIDIVALDENDNGIIFVECKWQDLNQKDTKKLIAALKEKSKHVVWNVGKRKESFAIFACKIEGKDALRKSGYLIWDLDDYYFISHFHKGA